MAIDALLKALHASANALYWVTIGPLVEIIKAIIGA